MISITDSSVKDQVKINIYPRDTNAQFRSLPSLPGPFPDENVVVDWVDLNMDKDFKVPSDVCTITIEDNKVRQLVKYMQRGNRVEVYLNGNLNMVGYIFKFKVKYSRSGRIGKSLQIDCKDLLEYMAQGSCPPNLGDVKLNNYFFPETFSLLQCSQAIIGAFINAAAVANTSVPQKLFISTTDNGDSDPSKHFINKAAGYGFIGSRQVGSKNVKFARNINKAMKHKNQPHKGESYLGFLDRLVKIGGAYIKMAPGSDDTIVIQTPTYDRVDSSGNPVATPFNIYHYLDPDKQHLNNVIDADLDFNLDKQYSAVIMESNSMNAETFDINCRKTVALNEFVAYSNNNATSYPPQVLPSVAQLVGQYVYPRILDTSTAPGPGYYMIPFSPEIYQQKLNLQLDIDTEICMPFYQDVDHTINALDNEELTAACSNKMAEIQDEYVVFTYELDGWTQTTTDGQSVVWQPNMLVNVYEEELSPGNPKQLTMWISKVNYNKSRAGTKVKITCHLPYTHQYQIQNLPPNATVKTGGAKSTYRPVPGGLNPIPSFQHEVILPPTDDQQIPVPQNTDNNQIILEILTFNPQVSSSRTSGSSGNY